MEATMKLRLGNLFDGPADLIVLPCSTGGSVTGFVARALVHHSIPHPHGGMKLGDVEIIPFEGAEDIAQYVCFAASVRSYTSTLGAIEAIGKKLGKFTREQASVRTLSAPLLGAGAGALREEDVVAALKRGFLSKADPAAVLVVHVLDQDVYERIRTNRSTLIRRKRRETIRVFISHTSRSDDAVNWVKNLALFLIEQGIQARLDKFHLRRGMDLPQWMCNELALAQKVIVVCDEAYKEKADGRLGGVGWETMIIQGDLANLPPDSTKYQVVVRAKELSKGLPNYLRTRYAFHAADAPGETVFREELVSELLDMPLDPVLEAKECRV